MSIFRWLRINLFVFDIAPEPLNKNIIYCTAFTIQAEPGLLKTVNVCREGRTGKLASPSGIDYFGCATPQYSHFKAFFAPFRSHGSTTTIRPYIG